MWIVKNICFQLIDVFLKILNQIATLFLLKYKQNFVGVNELTYIFS